MMSRIKSPANVMRLNKDRPEEVLKKHCQENGFKLTHQRVEIYHMLTMCENHPSAETLHKETIKKSPNISLETVYRTLNRLESMGLINRVYTPESRGRFDADTSNHHHLLCRECDAIKNVPLDAMDLDQIFQADNNEKGRDKVDTVSVIFTGICEKCHEPDDTKKTQINLSNTLI